MSWQQYIDSSLVGSGFVTSASMHGLDGNVWASSPNLKVSAAEAKALVGYITGDQSPLYVSGIKFAGEKYTFLRAEAGRSLYGRKGSDGGCCIVKTGQTIIIAVYGGGIQPGQCTKVVEGLADYLIGQNY